MKKKRCVWSCDLSLLSYNEMVFTFLTNNIELLKCQQYRKRGIYCKKKSFGSINFCNMSHDGAKSHYETKGIDRQKEREADRQKDESVDWLKGSSWQSIRGQKAWRQREIDR